MKTISKLLTTLAFGLGIPAWASAYVIASGSLAGTEVGPLDSLVAHSDELKNSSPATEQAWAASKLGSSVTLSLSGKDEDVGYYAIEGHSNYFAFQLTGLPEYFIVKNAKFWALFENLGDADWAVIDVSGLPAKMNIGKNGNVGDPISHVTQFNPGTPLQQVPLPGTLALLGLGLLGIGVNRRRELL